MLLEISPKAHFLWLVVFKVSLIFLNFYNVRYWLLNICKLRLHKAAINKKIVPLGPRTQKLSSETQESYIGTQEKVWILQ